MPNALVSSNIKQLSNPAALYNYKRRPNKYPTIHQGKEMAKETDARKKDARSK